MGWRPWEVKRATAHDFLVAWDGWCKVHTSPGEVEPPTRAELDKLLREYA